MEKPAQAFEQRPFHRRGEGMWAAGPVESLQDGGGSGLAASCNNSRDQPTATKELRVQSRETFAWRSAVPGKFDELKVLLDGMRAPRRRQNWATCAGDLAGPGLDTGNDAVTAHRETPHFKNYISKIHDLAERTVLVLDPVAVA